MDILERLYELDIALFYLINHSMSTPFIDGLMLFITKFDLSKVLMIGALSSWAIWKWRVRAMWVIVLAALAVGFSDLVSSQILKGIFGRIRPCNVLPDVHLLVGCTSSYSFPSSHAANIASAATVLIRFVPKSAFFMIPLASVVALSRVSVGVHWPSDAIGGIIVGTVCGLLVVLLGSAAHSRWKGGIARGRIAPDEGWFFLYTALIVLFFPIILLIYGKGVITDKKARAWFGERLGKIGPARGRPLWVHAASVGETTAAVALIEEIRRDIKDLPVILSVNTVAARSIAEGRLTGGRVCYFPLDFPWVVRRAINRIRPRAVVFMEAEIWPNFVKEAESKKIPVLLVNGRMSERTHKRFSYIGAFIRRVLGRYCLIAAQSEEYRARYTDLGCEPERVVVTGNIKYDIGPDERGVAEDLKRFLSSRKGRVMIAGSTHPGEEEIVLDAFVRLREDIPDILLILAPRHLGRTAEVERLLKSREIGYIKRSRIGAGGAAPGTAVLLLDTMGELAGLLARGDVVFIGGSLIPGIGGHNILEPAALGKPAVFGPFMGNFPQISKGLIDAGGGFVVRDAREIADIAARLLSDRDFAEDAGRRARELVIANRGATAKTAAAVAGCLSGNK